MEDEASELGKKLASLRKKDVEHQCMYCGKTFIGMAKSKYCSPAHRQADYMRRKKPTAQV